MNEFKKQSDELKKIISDDNNFKTSNVYDERVKTHIIASQKILKEIRSLSLKYKKTTANKKQEKTATKTTAKKTSNKTTKKPTK